MTVARQPSFVLGYHGTDRSVVEGILNGSMSDLKKSENDYDWLGNGLYFWENSHERAMLWAERFAKTKRKGGPVIKEPAVIGAVIDLGHCLDLLEQKSINLVKSSHEILVRQFSVEDIKLPTNDGHLHRLDCAVIENIHGMVEKHINDAWGMDQAPKMQQFDTVRAVFLEGKPLFETTNFLDQTHIQICVRNTKSIIGYFRPR